MTRRVLVVPWLVQAIAVTLAVMTPTHVVSAQKQATDDDALVGSYYAHDLIEIFSDRQELGRGFRTFTNDGVLNRIFTYPSSAPLNYEIDTDATFRLFSQSFNGGFSGTLGLNGQLAVYSLERPANSDPAEPDGYASLQLSVRQGNGLGDDDFEGHYSYHALQRLSNGDYQTSSGGVTADGEGTYIIARENNVIRVFDYDVSSDGRVEFGPQENGFGALVPGNALLVNTAEYGSGDDGEIPEGYTGLALYVRRYADEDATTDDFRGTYRVHAIAANGSSTPRADVGTITAGGNGIFFGNLGGAPYDGQIDLNGSGTFTFGGIYRGTLSAEGDIAVVTRHGSSLPALEIWVRTAGGRGNGIDSDGDGLTDTEEVASGTDPNLADTDGDGLLDNNDARPNTPDNVVVASLSEDTVTLSAPDTEADVALTLDSNDFPFFEWSLSTDVGWLTLSETTGAGDGVVDLHIDGSALEIAGSPFEATIQVAAPAMAPVAPLTLTVAIAPDQVDIDVAPEMLAFTVVAGGNPIREQVAIDSDEDEDFSWTVDNTPAWLNVIPEQGDGPGDVDIEVDPDTLSPDESPYTAEVVFRPDGTGPERATVSVTVDVVPPRDLDTPFALQPSEAAQSDPAAAFDATSGLWTVAWVENDQVRAMLLDSALVPVTAPVQVSIPALGAAANPDVVVVDGAREAWILFEQRADTDSDGGIQIRAFDLSTRALGNAFGFTTDLGDKSRPVASYNEANNTVVITYDNEFGDGAFVGYARIDGSTRNELSTDFPAANDNPQSRAVTAWLPDTNSWLLVWRESVPGTDNAVLEQVRAVRVDGETGNLLGETLVLDSNAPAATHLRVVAGAGQNRWVVAWSESPGRLQTVSVAGDGEVGTPYLPDEDQFASTPVAMAYNPESTLVTLLWSRSDDDENQGVYRHTTVSGQPLGEPVALPGSPGAASSVATGANPVMNEFLLVWEAPGTVPRQLRALRIAGGSGDVDEDGLPNEWELEFGLDPGSADGDDGAAGDPDNDRLTNLAEYLLGLDPHDPDGDDDGLLDGQEDRNSDGIIDGAETNPLEPDSDDDGVTDDVEWFLGSDGADAESLPESGIVRIDYGAWTPGVPGSLSVTFYLAEAAAVALQVNPDDEANRQPAPDWTMNTGDGEGFPDRAAGTHTVLFTLTPDAGVTPNTAYGAFRFVLRDAAAIYDARTVVLAAELLRDYGDELGASADALARTYAPVLRLHRDAVFTPIPVELSLGTAMFDPGNTMTLPAAPAPFDLYQSPYRQSQIDLPGTDTDGLFAAYPEPEERPAPTVYYTVAGVGEASAEPGADTGHVSLQYYFHFFADVWGLDQVGGHRHEGDWEVFQVLIDGNGQPYHAAATQQGPLAQVDESVAGGEGRAWDSVERDGGRPVLYVAKGSNGLYFAPGSTAYASGRDVYDGVGFWMLPESADGTPLYKPVYDRTLGMPLTPLRRLGEDNPTPWLRYAGLWGQRDFPVPDNDRDDPAVNDGPRGPAFMGTTLRPSDEMGVLRTWADPAAFAARMPDGGAPVGTTTVTGTLSQSLWGNTVLLLDPRGRIYAGEASPVDGSFALEVPVQPYALACVIADFPHRPAFAAMARFYAGDFTTGIVATVEGATDLGALQGSGEVLSSGANYAAIDTDGDGIVDSDDGDMDGDGIENGNDDDALGDGWADVFQLQDGDGDGIPAFLDVDDDGDGVPDREDSDQNGNDVADADEPGDVDGDGFVDVIDLDQDNDGYDNATEEAAGSDPRHYLDTPERMVGDFDGDGDIDAADGQQLVNRAIGRAPYDPRVDYNLNDTIDAVDLQLLINDILAGSS